MKTIAFDVDGTLITEADTPRYDVIDLLRWFHEWQWDVVIWSGGGLSYTDHWVHRLGIENVRIIEKGSIAVDIAVDDECVNLGTVNIRV